MSKIPIPIQREKQIQLTWIIEKPKVEYLDIIKEFNINHTVYKKVEVIKEKIIEVPKEILVEVEI